MAIGKGQARRPKTLSDLLAAEKRLKAARLTKLLVNVTIQGSVGAVKITMKPESTVSDLIAAAVAQYEKEGRRPALPSCDPGRYDLHYSQFSLERIDKAEKLEDLGCRNFFLYKRKSPANASTALSSSRSERVEKSAVCYRLPVWPVYDFCYDVPLTVFGVC